jgi:DNA-binding NarL/FixJ family response regulator
MDGVGSVGSAEEVLWRAIRVPDTRTVTPCRTLIVDDDDDIRFLVRAAFELANHGLSVAGDAEDSEQAMQRFRETDPNVVVLDFRMPGRNGLEVAADMLAEKPDQCVLLFSSYLTDETIAEAYRIGIRECVSKDQIGHLAEIVRKYCPAA